MHILAVYAALVWLGAWTFRRRVTGLLILTVSPIAFWMIVPFIQRMASIGPGRAGGPTLVQLFAAVFEALVLAVGLMLFVQSRATFPRACRHCRYDLAGNITGVCPECGSDVSDLPARTFNQVCPLCRADLGAGGHDRCPACARAEIPALYPGADARSASRARARASLAARSRHPGAHAGAGPTTSPDRAPRRHRRS